MRSFPLYETKAFLKELTDRLVKTCHPEAVVLYGSHAWGVPGREAILIFSLSVIRRKDGLMTGRRKSLRPLGIFLSP